MTFVFEVIIGLVPPLKGAFDKFNIIPPQNNWDFYTIRSVCMSKDCMPSYTF